MKNLLLIALMSLTFTVTAQKVDYFIVTSFGAVTSLTEVPEKGITFNVGMESLLTGDIEGFGFVTGVKMGYFSVSNTLRSTQFTGYAGFTDTQYVSGGIEMNYLGDSGGLGVGMWGRLSYPVSPDVSIILQSSLRSNVIDNNTRNFNSLSGELGIKYQF